MPPTAAPSIRPARRAAAPAEFRALVSIQAGSSRLPFFCVHGAGGNVLNFRDIARRLGTDQTFYGLQAKGVDGGQPLDSVEEMASLYLPEVERAQPRGPYLLGGYSGGGIVAFEMAQRLVRAGHEVWLLALLDTFRPGTRPAPRRFGVHLEALRDAGPKYITDRLKAKLSRHVVEWTEAMKVRFYTHHGQPLPFELREIQMARHFTAAADRYEPARYSGRTILYRAELTSDVFAHVGHYRGWDEFVEHLEVVVVPGDHDSLVYEPNVNVMTDHLARALREANARA